MPSAKSKNWARVLSTGIIFFAVLLFALFMDFVPWLAQLDRATYDWVLSTRAVRISPDIVIVNIDENAIKEFGPFPWPRKVHAALLRKLKEGGSKVAVFDMLFDAPRDPADDLDFALAMKEFGKVVLGKEISRIDDPMLKLEETIEPLPIFFEAGATGGFVSIPTDPDSKIRRATWQVKETTTLATEALLQCTGQRTRLAGGRIFIGDHEVPGNAVRPGGTFMINFAGPARTFPTRNYYQVLDGTIPRDFLKDKIVFIGMDLQAENKTGGPVTDRFPTPVDTYGVFMSGVEIHANEFNTLLTRSFIEIPTPKVMWLLLILFAVLTTLSCMLLRPFQAGFATAAIILATVVAVFLLFHEFNYWLPVVLPTVVVVLIYSGNTLVQYRLASKERAQISRAFKHYVSAEVLGELMKSPDGLGLGGREVEATVLFTDIAGFSKISEKISPQELTQMLNQYFELLASVVMKEGGMVNKFIGDAVMAIWGVPLDNPNHAIQACGASLKMHRAMLSMHPIKCRIGLNSGKMIAGNMGSRERFEYTVIGDAVNLASRLEGVNKPYHTDIMISEMTEEKVRGHFLLRDVDFIRVVGKEKPVRIFELLDTMGNKGNPEHERWQQMIESFQAGLEAYRNRKWEHAVPLFERHAEHFPEDYVGKIYLERCRDFMTAPPAEDWDGVYQMETK